MVVRKPLGNIRPRSVDFLDLNIYIEEAGNFQTDLFVKETKKNTYLSPESCHPLHIPNNIPFSLGYRILRACSISETFKLKLK